MVVMADELMTIGSFSLLTGLSIPTLRHYDEIGLLKPAEVDVRTSYRRYALDQVDVGRRVQVLREAGLSTTQIATVVGGDEDDLRQVVAVRRAELDQRTGRVQALLDQLLDGTVEGRRVAMQTATDFRLVAINIGVDSEADLEVARAFWGKVLGTDLEDWGLGSQQVVLGEGDSMGFFNIRVRLSDEPHFGHTSAFGLAVPGLDETHQRAIAAGAAEQYPPTDGEQMPRHSLIVDPVGNRVVLWDSGR